MTQVSYYEPKRASPSTLAIVIAIHAAGITALALAKTDVANVLPKIIHVYPVSQPVEPDPPPPEPVEQKVEAVVQKVHAPTPIVPLPPIESAPPIEVRQNPDPPVWIPPVQPGDGPIAPPRIEQAARAKGDVRRLFTPDDYPAAAVRRGETGSLRARLVVGADGRVSGCTLVQSSGSATLDAATCRILRARARFAPAKDAGGKATADTYVTPEIVWTLTDSG